MHHVNVHKGAVFLMIKLYPSGLSWKSVFTQSASLSWKIVSNRKLAKRPVHSNSPWRRRWRAALECWWKLLKTGNSKQKGFHNCKNYSFGFDSFKHNKRWITERTTAATLELFLLITPHTAGDFHLAVKGKKTAVTSRVWMWPKEEKNCRNFKPGVNSAAAVFLKRTKFSPYLLARKLWWSFLVHKIFLELYNNSTGRNFTVTFHWHGGE